MLLQFGPSSCWMCLNYVTNLIGHRVLSAFFCIQISPAASHSGWEDHFQSDQYHYLHHRFFECNYGTSGTPFDKMFGTFRDKLKETGTSYKVTRFVGKNLLVT